MKHILFTLLTSSAILFTTGCSVTPKYRVSVDAITASNVSVKANTSYLIEVVKKDTNKNSLAVQKFSKKLHEVLGNNGFVQPYASHLAQQTIYFDYGLEKVNEVTEVYTEPNISFSMGWGFPYERHYGHNHPFFFNNFYNGFYGGSYNTYSKTRTYYNRYITLLAKDQSSKELWRVDVSSVGESKNLRKIIPLLIEASSPYIGKNTDEPVQLVIKEKSSKK